MSDKDVTPSPLESEEKYDQVICPEDLFGKPIQLKRSSKPQDDGEDRKDGNVPLLPPKIRDRNDIIPARGYTERVFPKSTVRRAGSLLMLDAPERDHSNSAEDCDMSVHSVSASLKAFFIDGKEEVDAGQEIIPSFEYSMDHKFRGCFIIFNHMHFEKHLGVDSRKGTEKDRKNLEKTAKKLGFEYVRSFDDLSAEEIFVWIKKIANSDHSDYDCFAMTILTHGDEGDILYAHDAKYHIDAITEHFMAKNCPSLAGKPKMFFIQACRGCQLDAGAKVVEVANRFEKYVLIPNAADFLLAFSTVPGYYAWRNQSNGSWFVQALCKCLTEFGHSLELMQIMTRVNRMVAYDFQSYSTQNLAFHGKKQIPSIVTRLTHEVFFHKKGNSGSPLPSKSNYKLKHRKHSSDGKTRLERQGGKSARERETNL